MRNILRKFGFGPKQPGFSDWNRLGRSVARHNATQLEGFHEGRIDEPSMQEDTRPPELAEAVLAEVVRLNAEGQGSKARDHFDPAYAPFVAQLQKGGRGLKFCAILGEDEFLVNQGTSHAKRTTWHIKGERITEAETLSGFAWSRNRQHFLAVDTSGRITLSPAYGAVPTDIISPLTGAAFIPTGMPEALRERYQPPVDKGSYSHLTVSDDGRKILLCDDERGICLLRKTAADWQPELLYPSIKLGLAEQMADLEDGETFSVHLDMSHSALSPDGRYAAFGTQDDGHYLIDLDTPGGSDLHAKLGYLSEYPHDACFSDDSAFVTFNSCHFYNGVTFASNIAETKGLDTPPYEEHPAQKVVNTYLRVYASAYLPQSMTGEPSGAFLLAGSGIATCVTAEGKVLWELEFGSSAGSVDVCPKTGRILISSYSGMLHLLDPAKRQQPPLAISYKPPLETHRWLFWERLERPVVW